MTKKVYRAKKPWPTKDVMEQIYEKKLWGGETFDFYFGNGSHDSVLIEPYIDAVSAFLTSFDCPLTVCDLGCGDFNVGKQLVKHTKRYEAVDIVEDLIEHNKVTFKHDNLTFHCFDISMDDWPDADCVLLRQVLQHLSNAEVQRIARKLVDYKYVLVTEHIPSGRFIPNKDIISGQGIRLKVRSGIDLLAPPFQIRAKETRQLLSIPLAESKGVVVTTLYVFG